jgi:hypothetical protein
MNAFCEHHNNSIKFGYRCFDRILLNGLIQPFLRETLKSPMNDLGSCVACHQ